MQKFILNNSSDLVERCAKQLNSEGAVLLVPTETVYGLICHWQDQMAIERIYRLKQRDYGKPLALFVDSLQMIEEMHIPLPAVAEKLLQKFSPGPITVIITLPNGTTVGFRIPDHPFMLNLLKRCAHPLSSTSANCSGMPNALTVAEALEMLDGLPDIIVDAGSIPNDNQASTVVMVDNNNEYQILRHGPISEIAIMKVINA